MFCWHGSGALVFLEGKQTAMRYLDIMQIKYTLQCCIFILMATNTSWTIMHLYIEPEVFKIGSLSLILTSNTFPGHRIARILTPSKMCGIWWKDASDSTLLFHLVYRRPKKLHCQCIIFFGCKCISEASRLDVQTNQSSYQCKRVSNSLPSVCTLVCK